MKYLAYVWFNESLYPIVLDLQNVSQRLDAFRVKGEDLTLTFPRL